MTHNIVRAPMVMLLVAAFAASADAQRMPDVRGLHLGAAVNATSIKLDETEFSSDERENGYGANIYAGYNFTRNFGLLLSLTGSNINDNETSDFGVVHIDLIGRASFPGQTPLVPYIELGVAGVAAAYTPDNEDEVELSGAGLTLGAGLNYFFTRRVALDVGLRFTPGEFGTAKIAGREVDAGGGVGFNTTRVNVGLAFYP
ncbi:MAG: outer membrane protein [Gemmatimonadaceae bacterium]